MNKFFILFIIFVVGAGAFYGGMRYQASKTEVRVSGTRGGRGGSGSFISGEIITHDDTGVTIKLRDGGSKIVFFSKNTMVTKSVAGSVDDIILGAQATVMGASNSDGSIIAESVQLRSLLVNNKLK